MSPSLYHFHSLPQLKISSLQFLIIYMYISIMYTHRLIIFKHCLYILVSRAENLGLDNLCGNFSLEEGHFVSQ